MVALAAAMVLVFLPMPSNAYTGYDNSVPTPKYAVMDSFEAAWPYVDYTTLSPTDPGVTDWTNTLKYCPSALTPIGFTFPFYGTEYTQLHISPKGFVTFEEPTPCYERPGFYCYNDSPWYWGGTESQCNAAAEALYGPWDYYSTYNYYGTTSGWSTDYGYESHYRSTYGTPPTTYESKYCSGGYTPWTFPTTAKPNKFFGIWFPATASTCYGTSLGSKILSKVEGAPGERKLIVQYQGLTNYFSWYSGSSYTSPYRADFQIVLFEEDGHMEIQMRRVPASVSWSGLPVGIEDNTGGKGHKYNFRMTGTVTNRQVAYYPPPTIKLITDPEKACINLPFTIYPVVTASRTLGGITSYKWTFADGSTSSEVTPQKIYYVRGNYTVKLETTFAVGLKFISQTNVRVYNCIPPVAHFDVATDDKVGATPQDRSYDSDGAVVSWNWEWGDGTQPVTGSNPGTHVYEAAQAFDITLTVTDTEGWTDTYTDQVITKGTPLELSPGLVASAGADQTVVEGASVQLDGRGADAWRSTRAYWTQVAGRPVSLTGDMLQPRFTPPALLADEPETYTFGLKLYDGHHLSPIDTVEVKVVPPSGRPAADAGEPRAVSSGTVVALDATRSVDPEGGDLTYTWVQLAGEPVTLSDANAASPTFEAPETAEAVLDLSFGLTVSDGTHASRQDVVDIQVMPVLEVPMAGFVADKMYDLEPGRVVFQAFDVGEPRRYVWSFGDEQKGEGPMVEHTYATTGDYEVLLETYDFQGNLLQSHEQTVQVYKPDRSAPEAPAGAEATAPMASGIVLMLVLGALAMALRRRA